MSRHRQPQPCSQTDEQILVFTDTPSEMSSIPVARRSSRLGLACVILFGYFVFALLQESLGPDKQHLVADYALSTSDRIPRSDSRESFFRWSVNVIYKDQSIMGWRTEHELVAGDSEAQAVAVKNVSQN